jgi:RPA family protein
MESATRIFAGELCRSDMSVKGDDGDSSAWVVTPGGAWCRLLFIAGALTEVTESVDMVHCRVADPTGSFDLTIGGRRSPMAEAVLALPVPSFVSVSGRAWLYHKDKTAYVSIRPDHIRSIDRHIRDQWIVKTAESTLDRLEQLNRAIKGPGSDNRIMAALQHYATTTADLVELVAMVRAAVQRVVPPETGTEVRENHRDVVMEIIRACLEPRGIAVEEVIASAANRGIPQGDVLAAIESLIVEDECYQPQKGYVKPL